MVFCPVTCKAFFSSVAMQLAKQTQTQYNVSSSAGQPNEKSLLEGLYSICKQYEEMVLLPTCEKKLKF
jgi:hypothetical protein